MQHPLRPWVIFLSAAAMLLGAFVFWNQGSQTSAWIYPYFSGAANLGLDLAWNIDATTYPSFAQLSYAEQMGYEFVQGKPEDLAAYSILDRGYVFIVWIAQNVFFWLPSIKAVLWFQVVFHIVSVLWVLSLLSTTRQRVMFFLAYAVNPLVLHFVTFAYHYYWQVLPALLWITYESRRGKPMGSIIYLMLVVLMAAFLVRQSTLLVSLFMLGYWLWKERSRHAWFALLTMLVFVFLLKNPSQPWHTAYVGLGAYQNAGQIELSDESGYRRFLELTSTQIDTTPPHGNYYDETTRGEYYNKLRQELTAYATEHPLELIRNALLNSAQSFSVGYLTKSRMLSYLSATVGAMVLITMVWRRMYLRIAVLFSSVIGFVFYFPPIPAYMFGNYILLAWILAHMAEPWINRLRCTFWSRQDIKKS